MSEQEPSYGQIDISPTAVASIVSQAVNQSYGVVGMASKNFVDGIAQLLSRDPHKGIEVKMDAETIEIDVYVIIQYGLRIKAVAESIQSSVSFNVEKSMGRQVSAVNVYVQGLQHPEN